MAIRLLQAAKEFNVGMETMVNFLKEVGFDLIAKPSTKLTPEMHYALNREFAKDKLVKKKRDEVCLPKGGGNNRNAKKPNIDKKNTGNVNTKRKRVERAPGAQKIARLSWATSLTKMSDRAIGAQKFGGQRIQDNSKKTEPDFSKITDVKTLADEIKSYEVLILSAKTEIEKQIRQSSILEWRLKIGWTEGVGKFNNPKQIVNDLKNNISQYEQKIRDILEMDNISYNISSNNTIRDNFNSQGTKTIESDWNDITFDNGFIAVKHKGKLLDKFPVKNSLKSLNAIKAHYKFRNAPKLRMEINGNKIVRIVNIDVLFYYIQFLENAGSQISKQLINSIPFFGKYKTYTKSYYKKHMPELFQPECFSFLCELADNDLPIIPVPETVITSNGVQQIHDSFLFPLVNQKQIIWYWESVEVSKATYIFKTNRNDFEHTLQIIFDYLTGDTVNKRETLIQSKKLQQHLKFVKRLMHDDIYSWKNDVKYYAKI